MSVEFIVTIGYGYVLQKCHFDDIPKIVGEVFEDLKKAGFKYLDKNEDFIHYLRECEWLHCINAYDSDYPLFLGIELESLCECEYSPLDALSHELYNKELKQQLQVLAKIFGVDLISPEPLVISRIL